MKNWLDEYKPAPSDATRVNRTVIPKDVLLKGRVTQQQLDERVANDRRKRIADSNSAKNEKYTSKNWKSKLARETQATGDKLRSSPYPNFFDDYVNPAAMIGNMASGLGQVPLDIEQGNYGQAALNVALPLATGALAGIGAKTTGQFVNNLVNPLAGTSDLVNNLGNKHLSNLNKISINPSGILDEYLYGFRQGVHEQIRGLKGLSKRRPFFETFPITKNQKAKIIALQDKAFSDAKKFTEDYWYGGNSTMRPKLKEKIQELLPDIESDVNMHNLDKESSPFVTSKDLLIPSTYSTKGRENLSEEMIDYLNKHRGVIGGINSNGLSITLRNSGFYHKTPREIANTVVHEAGHTGQKFGYYDYVKDPNGPYYFSKKQWSDQLSQFDPNYGYFTSNPDTEIGRRFQKALVDPKIGEGNARYTYETWKSSPSELHSELMAAKHNLYKKGLAQGLSHEEMMERVTNPGEKELNWLLNHKNVDINKHFKETTPLKEKLELLKILPAAIPTTVGIGLATQQKQQEGGIINKYENGGEVYTNDTNDPPTREDSVSLYNNAKAVQDYYKNKKYKKLDNSSTIKSLKESINSNLQDVKLINSKKPKDKKSKEHRDFIIKQAKENIDFYKKELENFNPKNYLSALSNAKKRFKNDPSDDFRYMDKNGIIHKGKVNINEYYKYIDDNKFNQRELSSGFLDLRSPMPVYDKRIIPHKVSEYSARHDKGMLEDNVQIYEYEPLAIMPWDMIPVEQQEQRVRKFGTSGVPTNVLQEHPEWFEKSIKSEPIKKSVNKEVKPIIVNDKNDYRLKKYQDSLYVYNKFNKLYNDLLVQGKQGNKGVVEQIRDKMSPKEIDYFGDLGLPHSYKGLKPDYVLGTKTPRENRGYLPHYKKPKQPVIYEKPIPVIDVTKEDVKVENPPVIKSELENNGYGWVRDLQTNEMHRFHPITGELEYPFKGGQTHVNPKNPKNNSKLKMNMGGSLPGVTGMMYARTGAPSNGKYAKKTKPSAEDGIKIETYSKFNKLDNGGNVSYNQLVNFTNYNKPTSGGWLDEI